MVAESLEMRLKDSIRDVPDFPKPGIVFKDLTPILLDPALFDDTVDALTAWVGEKRPDKIIGIDARGFLFSAPVANRLGVGLVPVRKSGKLPYQTLQADYDLEYGVASIQIHRDAIRPGERVVILDDLLATGGTVDAAVRLTKELEGRTVGLGFVVELGFLHGRERLNGYDCLSLVQYP